MIPLRSHNSLRLSHNAPFCDGCFRQDTTARSFVVETVADLEKALSAPNDTLIFVESVMDPHDVPAVVIRSSNTGVDLDYGPRGPQHRSGVQLRPAI